jgi:hypothetical protein
MASNLGNILGTNDRDAIEKALSENAGAIPIKDLCKLGYGFQDIFEREFNKKGRVNMVGFRAEMDALRLAERKGDEHPHIKLVKERKELIRARSKITLLPHQVEHAKKLIDILTSNYSAFDLSTMGKGKTEVACYIARHFGMGILPICPKSVKMTWKTAGEKYDVDIINVISYNKLAGAGANSPDHGLLERKDYVKGKSVTFVATSLLKSYIKSGILIVLDEFQFIKNENQKYDAVREFVRCMTGGECGGMSRMLGLSGSPWENPVSFLYITRHIKEDALYRNLGGKKGIELTGFHELVNHCKKADEATTVKYIQEHGLPVKADEAKEMAEYLTYNILLPKISSAMPRMDMGNVKLDIANGFYKITNSATAKKLDNLIRDMAKAIGFDENTGTYDRKCTLAAQGYYSQLEESCFDDHVRVIKETLKRNPTGKVFLALTMADFTRYGEALKEFNPVLIDGKADDDKRETLVAKFNTDKECRIIISTAQILGQGVNLQDRVGDAPRFTYISATTKLFTVQQCSKRTYREGSKSDAYIRIFYPDTPHGRLMYKMYMALGERVGLDEMAYKLQNDDSSFPDNYPMETEPSV